MNFSEEVGMTIMSSVAKSLVICLMITSPSYPRKIVKNYRYLEIIFIHTVVWIVILSVMIPFLTPLLIEIILSSFVSKLSFLCIFSLLTIFNLCSSPGMLELKITFITVWTNVGSSSVVVMSYFQILFTIDRIALCALFGWGMSNGLFGRKLFYR